MPKVILVSQFPLPYDKIGSWTTLYKNYIKSQHLIDHIVCLKPDQYFENVKYSCVNSSFFLKLEKKFKKNPYLGYIEAILRIIEKNEKYIIQVVDNFGIIPHLQKVLVEKGFRSNTYVQFFYHGYSPFVKNIEQSWFFDYVDEMVLLTHDSYKAHRDYYSILPTRFSVLHNGIDISKFYPLSSSDKLKKREEKGIQDKKIFVWCAQDRPKKGLHIILDAWKRFYKQFSNTELWVIGCEPKQPIKGVLYYGRVPNDVLPHYFQISDCYLFPTLCHEGFGLSLIEALHCGLYCIASHEGGVPEVLQYGKFGKLIEEPHFVTEWENAMVEFMKYPKQFDPLPNHLYTTESWNKGMNDIIMNAKISLK